MTPDDEKLLRKIRDIEDVMPVAVFDELHPFCGALVRALAESERARIAAEAAHAGCGTRWGEDMIRMAAARNAALERAENAEAALAQHREMSVLLARRRAMESEPTSGATGGAAPCQRCGAIGDWARCGECELDEYLDTFDAKRAVLEKALNEERAKREAAEKSLRTTLDSFAGLWDDKPLPEDAAIDAAFPTNTGRHDLYAEAMRLVGARRSKGGLVELVNWLLARIATLCEVADALSLKADKVEHSLAATRLELDNARGQLEVSVRALDEERDAYACATRNHRQDLGSAVRSMLDAQARVAELEALVESEADIRIGFFKATRAHGRFDPEFKVWDVRGCIEVSNGPMPRADAIALARELAAKEPR